MVEVEESPKCRVIQVSNTKKPLFFYVNLAKKFLTEDGEVEISALGLAVATAVTISEILKTNGLVVEKKIATSTVDFQDEHSSSPHQKAKIQIWIAKSEQFDNLIQAASTNEVEGYEDGDE